MHHRESADGGRTADGMLTARAALPTQRVAEQLIKEKEEDVRRSLSKPGSSNKKPAVLQRHCVDYWSAGSVFEALEKVTAGERPQLRLLSGKWLVQQFEILEREEAEADDPSGGEEEEEEEDDDEDERSGSSVTPEHRLLKRVSRKKALLEQKPKLEWRRGAPLPRKAFCSLNDIRRFQKFSNATPRAVLNEQKR